MEEIVIYKFQLERIVEALRITSRINNCTEGKTCYDRQVRQSLQYAKNALEGKKDIKVSYITGKPYETEKSDSSFYQKIEKLINEWKEEDLGIPTPYSSEAEIEAGMKYFLQWLKKQNI